ncbi:MAG: DUF1376 domain-containing protein [Kordiimonadaceae bacterium]|nr:DUF1376 domain-containing protein [Kordiimonadaceae bacterium]MBT6033142.1 DUF1376 domain-containing protein [Kordiimonadaceae bacterium]
MKNIRDWRDSTLMLSFEEKGYFDELINLIYIYDDCLPDNDDLICRAMPVNKKLHLRLKQKLLKAHLVAIKDGFYHNKRSSQEIKKINQISSKNKVKALKRWAKHPKRSNKLSATAVVQDQPDITIEDADAAPMAILNLNSESDGFIKPIKINTKKKDKKDETKSHTRKCRIEDVLDPDGEVPAEYRKYAESQGLSKVDRLFCDWANWWVSENGRKAGEKDGSPPGKHGYVKMSTGNWLKVDIKRDNHGTAVVPPLRGRDWRLIDTVIDSRIYDSEKSVKIKEKDEKFWAEILMQGSAALDVAPFEHVLSRMTRLKPQKPTQHMDEQAVSVFLEDICSHLERRGYSYHAIDQGINTLIEREDDKFFPTMKVLLKYIHPLHWQLKQRIKKLQEILKQNHNKTILPFDNK